MNELSIPGQIKHEEVDGRVMITIDVLEAYKYFDANPKDEVEIYHNQTGGRMRVTRSVPVKVRGRLQQVLTLEPVA